MPLRLVYGAAGTGKSTYCMDEIFRQAQKKKTAYLIVPEQYSHIAETELIDRVGFLSEDIQATSFQRLSYQILMETGNLRPVIDSAGKSMMIARALHRLGGELTVFRGAAEKPGFTKVLSDIITEFKKAQTTPEQLLQCTAELDDNPLFRQKLTELGKIYEAYDASLMNKFDDADDNLTKLARTIPCVPALNQATFYIDGFFRFTAAELECIKAFLQTGADVIVTLCTPMLSRENSGIFAPVTQNAAALYNLAQEAGVQVETPVCLKRRFRFEQSAELAHLEEQYEAYPSTAYTAPTHDIALFSARDVYREVVYAAVQIKKTVKEMGIAYRDIAIIAGDLELYQTIIKTVFPLYEIPVFIDTKRDLLGQPVMLMFFSLLRILTDGFRTPDVISYLKSGYSGLSEEDADRLENFVLQANIRKQDWFSEERFTQRANTVFQETEDVSASEETERLLVSRNTFLSPILHLRKRFASSKMIHDRAEAIFLFIEEIGLMDQIQKQIDRFLEKQELQLADEFAAVYNLLIATLDQLVMCMGDESVGLKRLCSILEAGFGGYDIGVIPPANDQVFLGDVTRSLVKNVRALFIMGANDTAFPPSAGTEGILTDAERIYLAQKGLPLAPDTKKLAFDNQFLVYSAVNNSSEKLFVSYPVSDMEGKGLRPSQLVLRMKKLFPALRYESDVLEEIPGAERVVASAESACHFVLTHLREAEREKIVSGLFSQLYAMEPYQARLEKARQFSSFNHRAQRLSTGCVRSLYGTQLKGNISQFERYASCPFSYFVQYGLRAKERKILDLSAPDIGWLLHTMIDAFSKYVISHNDSFRDIDEAYCERVVDGLIVQMADRMFIKNLYSEKKLRLLLKRLKQLLLRSVWAICQHVRAGNFEPCAFEVSFDKNGDMPPVKIELPTGESITLVGRIDRIDAMTKGAELFVRIVDYKSGMKNFRLSDIYNRLSLQLAVYITAVWENGEALFQKEANPAGIFYFRLNDPVISAAGASADQEVREELLKKYKMSGLVLDDRDIIEAMDRGANGFSKVIPVRINKAGEVVHSSSSSATLEQFARLKQFVKKAAGEIGREILSGRTDIYPAHDGKTAPCIYCPYHSICSFDEKADGYRKLKSLPDEEIWSMLAECDNDITSR